MNSIFVLLILTTLLSSLLFLFYKRGIFVCCLVSSLGSAVGFVISALKECQPKETFVYTLLGVLLAQMFYKFVYTVAHINKERERKILLQPPKIFITGDKHRSFKKIERFCQDENTRRKDIMIVLGDAGFNYYGDQRDTQLKKVVSKLKITLFCIHGNKENRPQNINTYGVKEFCGGKVYFEPSFPNILFAVDGEIYTFNGNKYIVIGGAHSVDCVHCIKHNKPYWQDEIPDDTVRARVEERLRHCNHKIYGVLSHTCPMAFLPTEMFLSVKGSNEPRKKKRNNKRRFKPDINRDVEEWLGEIETRLTYEKWFCGHYHIDKSIDKIRMMFNDIVLLDSNDEEFNNGTVK